MNRDEAENYIYASYLKAQKYLDYGAADAFKRDPGITRQILRYLSGTPAVVVTGSKGKGSVANMISRIMQTRHKTGVLTSPHIIDFNERIRIDGKNISDEDLVCHIKLLKPRFDEIESTLPPHKFISPIGIQTAVALSYFNTQATGFNILECGKGARFDDVNNVTHSYAVISTVFLEHTRELGKTVEDIAFDKSHVITEDTLCAFTAIRNPEALEVIRKRAEHLNVPLKIYGRDFHCQNIRYTPAGMCFDVIVGETLYPGLQIPLLGEHQARNAALALAVCNEADPLIGYEGIKAALADINYPGRMQILSSEPFVMLDACINSESARNVKQTLDYLKIGKINLIMGIPDDKDYLGVAKALKDHVSDMILTKSQNPHYVFTSRQIDELHAAGIAAEWTETIEAALEKARASGGPTVILGTTSLISEVLNFGAKCQVTGAG